MYLKYWRLLEVIIRSQTVPGTLELCLLGKSSPSSTDTQAASNAHSGLYVHTSSQATYSGSLSYRAYIGGLYV